MFAFVCAHGKKLEYGSEGKVFVSLFHDEGKYMCDVHRYRVQIYKSMVCSDGKQESFCWVENVAIFRTDTRNLFGEFGTLSHTAHRAVLRLYVTNLRLNFVVLRKTSFLHSQQSKIMNPFIEWIFLCGVDSPTFDSFSLFLELNRCWREIWSIEIRRQAFSLCLQQTIKIII